MICENKIILKKGYKWDGPHNSLNEAIKVARNSLKGKDVDRVEIYKYGGNLILWYNKK